MYYHLIERKNPLDQDEPKKFYAVPRLVGRVDAAMLAKQIATQTTLTTGDVSNVLKTFIDLLPMFMLMGKTVELEGFGTMRVSFSSDGVESEEQFSVRMMRRPKVVFLPSPELKRRIADGITYQRLPKEK